MSKQILFGSEGRNKVLSGITKAADAAKHTLGVVGKSAMISYGNYAPDITDDGVTVLKNIVLADPFENMGAQLLKRVAIETNEKAGDGTTTSSVLAQAFVEAAVAEIGEDSSKVRQVVDRLNRGLSETIVFLEEHRKEVTTTDEILNVATVSCLDPEIGAIIADTMERVGKYGVVTVDESPRAGMHAEVVNGLRVDSGLMNEYFIENKERNETELVKPHVIVTDARITTNEQIKSILVQVKNTGNSSAILFAEEIAGEALATLVLNFHNKGMRVIPIRLSGSKRREVMRDVSLVTGAKFITEEMGQNIKDATLSSLGMCGKAVFTKNHVTILKGWGDEKAIMDHCDSLGAELDESASEMEKEALKRRLASMTGGIGVIRVGAHTDTELRAKKYKIEDAINATRCAIEEGILPGGGAALAHAGIQVQDPIFQAALFAPVRQMGINAGMASWSYNSVDPFWTGYDFKEGAKKDLYEAGILDPFKVTRLALENAVSIAATLITAETFIVEEEKPTNEQRLQ